MKKLIIVNILLLIILGCIQESQYELRANALAERKNTLQTTDDNLQQEISEFNKKTEFLDSRYVQFLSGLTNFELDVLEKIISKSALNPATAELNRRQLFAVLTEENKETLQGLLIEAVNLESERTDLMEKIELHQREIVAHNQSLASFQKEVALLQELRQQHRQMMNENNQRFYDRMAYGYQRQPSILYMPQQNPNYWQEQLAQKQLFQYQKDQRDKMFKLP